MRYIIRKPTRDTWYKAYNRMSCFLSRLKRRVHVTMRHGKRSALSSSQDISDDTLNTVP